jgi:hypothetical protein
VATLVAEPRRVAGPGLKSRVAALRGRHARLWSATPAELPGLGPATGWRRRLVNARAAGRLIDGLAAEVDRLPEEPAERRAWQERVRETLQDFGATRLGWPAGYRRLLFADAFYASALAFVREARSCHPELSPDSLWQGLRNVLIGNSLQVLLDREVALRPGLFAYSMLYPLTDNLLDDARAPAAEKRAFNERFGRRLKGRATEPRGPLDAAVFALVARIEEEFPRAAFPDVHESLLAIHAAQARSLLQQDEPRLTDDEVLAISCEKGGTSVLADLLLVTGGASGPQESFAFGFGVSLQLLDDLQDVEADLEAGHQTLFARAARLGPLDEPTARLARFIEGVVEAADVIAGPAYADRRDLIRRNCLTLLVSAVAAQPARFTRRFRRAIERQWPLSLRALRRLRRRAETRAREASRALRRRAGASSLLDLAIALA